MPHALVLGMTKQEFMKSKPCELVAYTIADKIKQKRRDEELWRMGIYVAHALECTVCNSTWFRGKHSKPFEYLKEPILFKEEKDRMRENVYKESQEEIAVFEMKQRIRELEKQGLPQSPS